MDVFGKFCGIAILTTLCGALLGVPVRAQVAPSAFGAGKSLWAGAEYSDFSASFPYQSGQHLQGFGVFADFHLNRHLGIEGDGQFMDIGGFQGSTESSYLAGPRVFVLTRGKLQPFGKFLAGVGQIHYPFQIGNASYLALAPAGGVEYRLRSRWLLRAEYEYQLWPDSPGYANVSGHELTPNGFHVGVAYRVFR